MGPLEWKYSDRSGGEAPDLACADARAHRASDRHGNQGTQGDDQQGESERGVVEVT